MARIEYNISTVSFDVKDAVQCDVPKSVTVNGKTAYLYIWRDECGDDEPFYQYDGDDWELYFSTLVVNGTVYARAVVDKYHSEEWVMEGTYSPSEIPQFVADAVEKMNKWYAEHPAEDSDE